MAVATSFGVLNYSGMLFNKGNTKTPLSSIIGGRVAQTNHVEFVVGQEYTGGGNGSQPAISENASLTAPTPAVVNMFFLLVFLRKPCATKLIDAPKSIFQNQS